MLDISFHDTPKLRESGCYKVAGCSTYIKVASVRNITNESFTATIVYYTKKDKIILNVDSNELIFLKNISHWIQCSEDECI